MLVAQEKNSTCRDGINENRQACENHLLFKSANIDTLNHQKNGYCPADNDEPKNTDEAPDRPLPEGQECNGQRQRKQARAGKNIAQPQGFIVPIGIFVAILIHHFFMKYACKDEQANGSTNDDDGKNVCWNQGVSDHVRKFVRPRFAQQRPCEDRKLPRLL